MDHSLINPNQLRHFGVMVHDNPFDTDHPLMIKELSDGVFIRFQIKGTTVFFDSHTPTSDELDNCRHIVLTSDNPWNPGTVELGCSDVTVTGADVSMVSEELVSSADKVILAGISCVYYPDLLAEQLRVVSQVDVPRLRTFVSDKRYSAITAPELSERWHIGNRQAKDTLTATTQKYTRSAILPLSRRYRSDRNFYRRHLNHEFAADLYLGRAKSARGNIGAYVFTHKCGFAQAYPMRTKNIAELAEALRQFTIDWGRMIYSRCIRSVFEHGTCFASWRGWKNALCTGCQTASR
jgi:hypothetical protein